MKTKILSLFGALAMAFSLSAQNRLAYTEFGVGIGSLNYSGDIATTKTTGALLEEMRPNLMLFAKRNLNDWFALGIYTSYGFIYANDENHTHQNRGLQVTTTLFQVNPYFEINFIKFGKFHYDNKFSIYIKGGGGFLAYNPDPEAAEVFPDEFEPNIYAYNSFNYFGAAGLKFRLGYETILSIDVSIHNSGADNLDGVVSVDPAERGANDTYGGINIMLSHAIF